MPQIALLYEKYYADLIRLGRFNGAPESEVKDIINQTFLDLAEKKIDFTQITNPAAYVKVSFRRKLIDNYRAKKKNDNLKEFLSVELEEKSPLDLIVSQEEKKELVEKLYDSFQKLPRRCQRVIYLKYFSRLSNEQIADATGLSMQSVYNNLSEGIRLLRRSQAEWSHLRLVGWVILFANMMSFS